MNDFKNDYAALAAADRRAANKATLENVRRIRLSSAECWDRLANEKISSIAPLLMAPGADELEGEKAWKPKQPT